VIRDRAALSGTDITDPKANFDQFGQPDRHLQLHGHRPPTEF